MASLAILGLFINVNQWAIAVLPVILLAPHVRITLKRQRHLFYWFYPAHLCWFPISTLGTSQRVFLRRVSRSWLFPLGFVNPCRVVSLSPRQGGEPVQEGHNVLWGL
jgi:hypothetical protein